MINQALLLAEVGRLLNVLYAKRFAALEALTLQKLLAKNPYLYRALGQSDAGELIKQMLMARVSSSDETIFGNDFFEPLAKFAAQQAFARGQVTVGAAAGQDIAIETATEYLAISVKSGTNIFNSQSQKGQSTEFGQLQARMKKLGKMFRPIVGYGYGRKTPKKASAVETLAGQVFWQTLTNESDFYLRISQAMEAFASEHAKQYDDALACKHMQLLKGFMAEFVSAQGRIDWDLLVAFNSSATRPKKLKLAVP